MFEKAFLSISALAMLDICFSMSKSFLLCDSFLLFFFPLVVSFPVSSQVFAFGSIMSFSHSAIPSEWSGPGMSDCK